jgi:hypothetical protein
MALKPWRRRDADVVSRLALMGLLVSAHHHHRARTIGHRNLHRRNNHSIISEVTWVYIYMGFEN